MPIPVFLVQHHLGSPINTGIISQCCQSKQRTAASRKYIRYVILLDEIQQNRTRFGYTAADYKKFPGSPLRQYLPALYPGFHRNAPPLQLPARPLLLPHQKLLLRKYSGCFSARWLIVLLQPALRQPYNTGGRGILLQAAVIAAVASFTLSVHHMDMADLACCPGSA